VNNNQATLNKLEGMRLFGMARAFRSSIETHLKNKFTPDELLSHLVDAEWDDRRERKLARLKKAARFRYTACLEDIDFGLKRNLDKNLILRLSDCSWIKKAKNIIITGSTGVGKSFISIALGHQGCMHGYKTEYYSCCKLFRLLNLYKAEGKYSKELNKIRKKDILIIDDFGLERLDPFNRLAFLEILEDRHGRSSTIIVSQIPVNRWHDVIVDLTLADAICDRIIHTSYRIELKGESVRKLFSNSTSVKDDEE
jgi:DNA replication protein DnaC